jgi:hypothetical protein
MTDTSYAWTAPGPWGDPTDPSPAASVPSMHTYMQIYTYVYVLLEGPHGRHKLRLDCAWALGVFPRPLACSRSTFYAYFYEYIYVLLLDGPHDRHKLRLDCAWALGGTPPAPSAAASVLSMRTSMHIYIYIYVHY